MAHVRLALVVALGLAACAAPHPMAPAAAATSATKPQHLVFFAHERERIRDAAFLANPRLCGAQLKYTWRELEPQPGEYAFDGIRADLAFLQANGKALWIQLQDVTFDERKPVPDWLCTEAYGGGAARKYEGDEKPETEDVFDGWVARRWDPRVQARFAALLEGLGREFDGAILGINLAETAIGFGDVEATWPQGFTPARYAEAVKENVTAAKRAFPKSHVVLYANFLPGEWLPWDDKGFLKSVHAHCAQVGAGVGGPDLRPLAKGQQTHILPLLRARAEGVVAALAVQDGNLDEVDKKTGRAMTVQDLLRIAEQDLRLDYLFWGTQEPHYTSAVLPALATEPVGAAAAPR
ncbi:MAG: hypothetical protein FJZ38_26510 [Candidatus Rokubacteria bacterium]|nr:hypothetical protein [Candidatus Rokubacteria bacterium]